jgi:hypothetical protein
MFFKYTELPFILSSSNTQEMAILDSYAFQISRTSWFFDSDFLKYLEPASSWILILQTPRTGGSLKNQRICPILV